MSATAFAQVPYYGRSGLIENGGTVAATATTGFAGRLLLTAPAAGGQNQLFITGSTPEAVNAALKGKGTAQAVKGGVAVNPPFDLFVTKFNYPYTLRENLTGRQNVVRYRALVLENEHLKLIVLPELGGHLYTCIDKANGAEMFYAQKSIRKAQIGYRGAWAAYGIEFNFPVSHNWATVSPVDFGTARHDGGSASVWVGSIDRPYGMQWRVELRLRPGRSLLEQTTTLYNRSDVRHRFYWWTTASVGAEGDSHILYPMAFSAAHHFADVDTWPVDSSGVDLSYPRNHVAGFVSRFAHGSREGFIGVYNVTTDSGMVHVADHHDMPGQKIWSWGWDDEGKDWRRARLHSMLCLRIRRAGRPCTIASSSGVDFH